MAAFLAPTSQTIAAQSVLKVEGLSQVPQVLALGIGGFYLTDRIVLDDPLAVKHNGGMKNGQMGYGGVWTFVGIDAETKRFHQGW